MSPRTNPLPDPIRPVAQPGILSKSGLDITLENIDKHLASIDEKLATSPTMAHYEDLHRDWTPQKGPQGVQGSPCRKLRALEEKYADKKEFSLVQKMVFTAADLILTVASFVALVALVVNAKVVP